MSAFMIVMGVSQKYILVKIYQNVLIKYEQLTVYQLYPNKCVKI